VSRSRYWIQKELSMGSCAQGRKQSCNSWTLVNRLYRLNFRLQGITKATHGKGGLKDPLFLFYLVHQPRARRGGYSTTQAFRPVSAHEEQTIFSVRLFDLQNKGRSSRPYFESGVLYESVT
jgi:hypothetical protein